MLGYYEFLDQQLNDALKTNLEFDLLLSTKLYKFDPSVVQGFFDRYSLIKEFQEITLSLFNASLNGDEDPEIASLVFGDLPENQAWDHHKELNLRHTPAFFRTDEVVPGKISEVQCPASLWGVCDQLFDFFKTHSKDFGKCTCFSKSPAENFSESLKKFLPSEPKVHHLMDNSSVPHDMRYFIQKTRNFGIRYFSYDKDVTPYSCNLVRSHDFAQIYADNFFRERLEKYQNDSIQYDLPPSILFDVKIIYFFPFWEKTRKYYPDKIREIFPFTQLVQPNGFFLEDGSKVDTDTFSSLSAKNRGYYIKYAGSDLSLNWGSKGVFRASAFSGSKCREFLHDILKGYPNKRYWVIQKAYFKEDRATYFTRKYEIEHAKVHSKVSGFYGPSGLNGILMMQRPFYKVHGSKDTIVSICQ